MSTMGKRSPRRLRWTLAAAVIAAAWVASGPAAACPDGPNSVLVRVNQVRSASGNVAVVLYGGNPEHFLKRGHKLRRVRVPARQGTVETCLQTPGAGVYAIAVYHDENGNKKFDKSWIGIPTEGYGFSNDPSVFLAPPSLDEAAFELHDDHKVLDLTVFY